jgi:hypothetical protein
MSLNQDFIKNFKYSIVLSGVSAVIAFFIFGRAVSISIILGSATILWGMSHLAKQNRKMIQADGKKHTKGSGYLIRFLLYAIVLGLSYYLETLNIFGTFYGLMTFKVTLYAQSLIHMGFGGKKA